jgi:hypothetical protein
VIHPDYPELEELTAVEMRNLAIDLKMLRIKKQRRRLAQRELMLAETLKLMAFVRTQAEEIERENWRLTELAQALSDRKFARERAEAMAAELVAFVREEEQPPESRLEESGVHAKPSLGPDDLEAMFGT